MKDKLMDYLTNKKIMVSVIVILILVGTGLGYTILNQPQKQNEPKTTQQEAKEFTVSELLEMKVYENKTIEITDGDLAQMTFEVKDGTIASIDEKGVITGIKAGETEVVVKADGKEKVCKIVIGEKEVTNTDVKKEETESKKTAFTTDSSKKPSGSSMKPSTNETTTKPSTGNTNNTAAKPETSKPESKPEPKPKAPKSNVTYSYIGRKYYDWAVNLGGYVTDGIVIIGDPDQYGGTYAGGTEDGNSGSYWIRPSRLNYSCIVDYIGKGDKDYKVSLRDGFDFNGDNTKVVEMCINNVFENPADVKKHVADYYSWGGWTYNGRNYKVTQDVYGIHVHVSAKAN